MKIPVRSLRAGDAIRLHDWVLHIVQVDHDVTTAALIAELEFRIHFGSHDWVERVERVDQPASAA